MDRTQVTIRCYEDDRDRIRRISKHEYAGAMLAHVIEQALDELETKLRQRARREGREYLADRVPVGDEPDGETQ